MTGLFRKLTGQINDYGKIEYPLSFKTKAYFIHLARHPLKHV